MMKKLLALLLAMVMVFALAACGGGSDDVVTDDPAVDAPADEAEDENTIRENGKEYTIDVSQMTQDFSGHAGGDSRMVEEFLDVVRGAAEPTSRMTTLEASVESHFIALAAERSRLEQGRSIPLSEISGKA